MPQYDNDDSIQLIEQYQHGDQEAINELFRRHYEAVRRFVVIKLDLFLRKKEEVDDLVQGALLQAFKDVDRFERHGQARFVHWLTKVVEHQISNKRMFWRADKRNPDREVDRNGIRKACDASSVQWEPAGESKSPASKAEDLELKLAVDQSIQELPDAERDVIMLRNFVGADWQYISEELDKPTAAAAKQLHQRAKARLTNSLLRRGLA